MIIFSLNLKQVGDFSFVEGIKIFVQFHVKFHFETMFYSTDYILNSELIRKRIANPKKMKCTPKN